MSELKIEWRHVGGRQWNLIVDNRVMAHVYDFNDLQGYWQIDYCKPKSRSGSAILRDVGFLTAQLRALELAGVK